MARYGQIWPITRKNYFFFASIITTGVGLGYPSPAGRTSVGLCGHTTVKNANFSTVTTIRLFIRDLGWARSGSGPPELPDGRAPNPKSFFNGASSRRPTIINALWRFRAPASLLAPHPRPRTRPRRERDGDVGLERFVRALPRARRRSSLRPGDRSGAGRRGTMARPR
jgi:hypothetical protein